MRTRSTRAARAGRPAPGAGHGVRTVGCHRWGRDLQRGSASPRFAIGLPASALVLLARGDAVAVGGARLGVLVVLAPNPGLLGLALYYLGLRRSAASRASLAELSFPLTATIIGVTVPGTELVVTQWLGLVVVVVAVTALGLRERSSRPLIRVSTGAQPATDQA